MKITGTIEQIFETQQVTDTFKKREFVLMVADNPQYPEHIKLEFIQDKVSILDSYAIGDNVDVEFNLKGRKWTNEKNETKYFNTLQAWKINKITAEQSPQVADDGQDLPF